MFVPLFNINTVYENYTFFSSQHLMDKLNLLLFMFPVGSILWVALLIDNWGDLKKDKLSLFFLICCLLGFVFIVLWNPDFGAKLDYNLFSPAILAMSVFTSYNLSSNLNKEYYPYITILALFVSLFHLLPIVLNTA
ncbi:MAG: hypothetical protein QXU74_00825 [Candidatus Aenigmatarchaeota archaeon]